MSNLPAAAALVKRARWYEARQYHPADKFGKVAKLLRVEAMKLLKPERGYIRKPVQGRLNLET